MLELREGEAAGYETLALPDMGYGEKAGGSQGPGGGRGCWGCAAFHPAPELDGVLRVDPEIHLPSPGMDVDIAYYYSSQSQANGPFGYGRTLNLNLSVQASGPAYLVTFTRGNGSRVVYQDDGSGHRFTCLTPGVLNSLDQDGSYWMETTPDGRVSRYPLDGSGTVQPILSVTDSVGNTHAFSYAGGLLVNLLDAVGRRVTLSYAGGLLESIRDWAGRVTTFLYDTASVAGASLLTTVIGPTGCQTVYGYDGTPYLTLIQDPMGHWTTYAYDAKGRVSERTIVGFGTTHYQYVGHQTVVTDALGQVTTYQWDPVGSPLVMIDPLGHVFTATRNVQLQEISRQDPLGHVWTTLYDGAGNPVFSQDPLGQATHIQHDAYNNPTTLLYPDGAQSVLVWGYPGSPFDATGQKRRLQATLDPLGNRTTYGYTPRGLVASVMDALGQVTTYLYLRHEVA